MKKFLLLFSILLFVIMIPVALVNFFSDPAGTYHAEQEAYEIVEGLEKGYNVVLRDGNTDERVYKKILIERMYEGKCLDFIVMGPSRVFLIDSSSLNTKSILNLGVSAAQINDFAALYQICKDNQVTCKNMIIGCDATMFNITDTRWQSIEDDYNKFIGIDVKRHLLRFDKIENLFSISYFQSGIKKIRKNLFVNQKRISYSDSYINDFATRHADGSISYAADYRNKTTAEVNKEAGTWMHSTFKSSDVPNKSCVDDFKLLISKLKQDGVNIYFFYCPYHPIFYDRVKNMDVIKSGTKVLNDISKEFDIMVIGSYNPNEVGCSNADFYDAAHMRKEAVDKFFMEWQKEK